MSDDVEDADDLDLDEALGLGASDAPVPERPRFYCAGARRADEDTGKKLCDYRAPRRWRGACPGCGRLFACLLIKKGKNAAGRVTLGEATMAAHKPMVYHPTGISELDKVLGGGVVYEKLIMFAAPQGAGKTTLLLQACDGFARKGKKAYFATGEMTQKAVIDYAQRLGIENNEIALFGDPEGVDVEDLFEDVIAFGAKFLVIDSLPVCSVSDVKGDIGQPTMMDAVINMVSSFVQKKNRAAIIINHLNKGEDYSGARKVKFLVDGLLRMDYNAADYDEKGRPTGPAGGVRKIYMDAKSRQGDDKVTSLIEMRDGKMQSPSLAAIRALSNLQVVR